MDIVQETWSYFCAQQRPGPLLGAWGVLGALSLASSSLGWSRGSRHRCATLVLGAIIIGPGARAWLFRVGITTDSDASTRMIYGPTKSRAGRALR